MKRNLRIGTKTYTDIDKVIVTDADTNEAVTVVDTSDASAVNVSVLDGYTGYVDSKLITGTAQELNTSDIDAFLSRSVTDFVTNATAIKAYFAYLYSLTSITAPNVLSIGTYAFYTNGSVDYLDSVYLPSVTTIGDYAFFCRRGLTTLDLPSIDTIGRSAFYSCSNLVSINIKTATNIGDSAFGNCASLTKLDLSDDLVSIPANAFYNPIKVTSITAHGVTSVGEYAFYSNTATTNILTTIDMPKLQVIGDQAFNCCYYVASCNFFDTVVSIGSYSLSYFGYYSGTTFEWLNTKDTAISIGAYGLAYSNTSKISGKWTITGNYAFAYCYQLASVDIDLVGTYLYTYSFYRDSAITSVKLSNCTAINSYAFYGCTKVGAFAISGSHLTSVGTYAFYNFGANRENYETSKLTLDFSDSVFTTVNTYTFSNTKYTDVIFPTTLTTIAATAFSNASNLDIYLPGEVCVSLSTTTAFSGNTTSRVFVNYNVFNAYRTATNWSDETILSYLHPYAPAGTFEAGILLPELNSEGYEVTWYSDVELTTQITTMPEESVHIYCSLGQEQVGYPVAISCRYGNVIVSDGTYTYKDGNTIKPDTAITITFKPEDNYIYGYSIVIDENTLYSQDTTTDLTNFVYDYTTEDSGLTISAVYWDGTSWLELTYITNLGNYTFTQLDTGYWTPNNGGIANSAAIIRLSFNNSMSAALEVTLYWLQSSEANYDYGIVGNIDQALSTSYSVDSSYLLNARGTTNTDTDNPNSLVLSIPTGEHFIDIKYRKDSSVDTGWDAFRFKVYSPDITE